MADGRILPIEVLAHDLAMAYLTNRYGPEVSGTLTVTASGDGATFDSTVSTDRLPAARTKVLRKVAKGEKRFLGMMDKKEWEETDEFQVDAVFNRMIDDYDAAYVRFLHLLNVGEPRHGPLDPDPLA